MEKQLIITEHNFRIIGDFRSREIIDFTFNVIADIANRNKDNKIFIEDLVNNLQRQCDKIKEVNLN